MPVTTASAPVPSFAEQRLAAIVESSDDAIVSKDLAGTIQSWNRGAEELFGYTANEAKGQPITMLIPSDLGGEEEAILARLRRGEKIVHHETVRLHKSGRRLDVSLSISPVRDERGNVIGASKVARDITDRKRAERSMAEINAALEERVAQRTSELRQALHDLESFNYTISHDLRAPLRAITGFSRALIKDTTLTERQRLNAEYVYEAATEMERMTDALLGLARIQARGAERQPVDLSEISRQIMARVARADPKRRVRVRIEDGLVTSADPKLAEVVMENLLGNAWKFTANNPEAQIRVGSTVHGDRRLFVVEDNGVGLGAGDADRVFRPFQRLRPDEFEGSGIGLATVHRIIRVHAGHLEADGEVGVRATFRFCF